MRRGQLKWQRGWVQRKPMFITEGVIFPLSKRRYWSSGKQSSHTRDKQALKKIQLSSLPVLSSPLCSSFTTWYKRFKEQKRLWSCSALVYTTPHTSYFSKTFLWKGSKVTLHKRLIKEVCRVIVHVTSPFVKVTSKRNMGLQLSEQNTQHTTECQITQNLNASD